jgi:hypothetical protein
MYNHLKLEDRFFAPSSIDLFLKEKSTLEPFNYNNLFYLFQSYQPKASILNPYSIAWILKNIIDKERGRQGRSLFTPVLSWGSYITAFMHSDYQEYTGVDVMPNVCHKCQFLAKWYQDFGSPYKNKSVEILCQPSETLKLQGRQFDTILLCPPYYDMEIYNEGQQSIISYPDYNQWVQEYWGKTVQICKEVLAPDGIFAWIGNDYSTLSGEIKTITKDLNQILQSEFSYVNTYYLQNRTSPLRSANKDRTERLFIYKK